MLANLKLTYNKETMFSCASLANIVNILFSFYQSR